MQPLTLNVAVANGLGNAKKLVKEVQEGRATYHFVEIMACPGGGLAFFVRSCLCLPLKKQDFYVCVGGDSLLVCKCAWLLGY